MLVSMILVQIMMLVQLFIEMPVRLVTLGLLLWLVILLLMEIIMMPLGLLVVCNCRPVWE